MPLRPRYRARLMLMDDANFRTAIMKVVRALEAMVLALFVALVLGAVAMWPVITGRAARTTYVNDQIRNIWCTLVDRAPDNPLDPEIHKIRVQYHCGAFNPKNAPATGTSTASSHKPDGKPKPSVAPGAAGKPSPSPTPTPDGVRQRAPQPSTKTRTVVVPTTRVLTRTTTKTGLPLPTSFPMPTAICPVPIVGVLVC